MKAPSNDLEKGFNDMYKAAIHYAEAVRLSTRRRVLSEVLSRCLDCEDLGQMKVLVNSMLHESYAQQPEEGGRADNANRQR